MMIPLGKSGGVQVIIIWKKEGFDVRITEPGADEREMQLDTFTSQ